MKKNEQQLDKRRALVQLAARDPEKAARYLEHLCMQLRSCTYVYQVVNAMCEVLFLSEATVSRDILSESEYDLEKYVGILFGENKKST